MPTSTPLPLSVVIISLNEEKRIGDCLHSVRDLSIDVVVVDAHSCDRTREICLEQGARVFERPWTGYSAQKNFGNCHALHHWILSLDSDERVSDELARAIREEFARGPQCDAYAIRFANYFGDQHIRFGAWNPEWHVRLFDRRKLQWNTNEVHEGLCSSDTIRIGRLRGCIHHRTVDSSEQLAAKTEGYSDLFAAQMRRGTREPHWGKVWLNPGWRFVRDYLFRLGALDGKPGAIIAWEAARYTHLKYAKVAPRSRSHPLRPLDWLTFASSCLLLAFVLAQVPHPGTRSAPRDDRAAQTMTWDDDDDFDLVTLASDADDDVIV